MSIWWKVLGLFAMLAGCSAKKASKSEQKGIDTAESLIRRGSVGPYALTGENFTRFATERPRIYQAGLFFTAGEDRCPDCAPLLREYSTAAALFDEQHDLSAIEPGSAIFFFVISANDSPELFHSLGISFVPQLFVIGPKGEADPRQPLSDFAVDIFDGDMVRAISEMAGVEIKRRHDVSAALTVLVPLAAVLAFVVTAVRRDPSAALLWYRSRALWVPVCAVCFAIGVSGAISCVIRGADWLSYEGRSRRPFVFGGSDERSQNYAEGVAIALLTLVCGAALFLVYYTSRLPIYVGRDVLVLVGVSLFIVAFVNMFQAYAIETPYYQMSRLLPFQLWEWYEAPVKKGSGLAKRLLRMASFALTECTSLEQFAEKARVLLLPYAKRAYLGHSA